MCVLQKIFLKFCFKLIIYIYIYIYVCVCVCVSVNKFDFHKYILCNLDT